MPAEQPSPVVGIVLAGGSGASLSPLAPPGHPSALLPVGRHAAIFYALLSLLRARVTRVAIIACVGGAEDLRAYVESEDTLVGLDVVFLEGEEGAGTVDALREQGIPRGGTFVVVSADLVSDVDIGEVVDQHVGTGASCTVMLAENCERVAKEMRGVIEEEVHVNAGKGKGKKEKVKVDEKYEPEMYATLDGGDGNINRLLGIVSAEDLWDESDIPIRAPLLRRFSDIHLRADLRDPHVYVFAAWVFDSLIQSRPQISSLRTDLVPYLVRRQFTLARGGVEGDEDWSKLVPSKAEGDVVISAHIVPFSVFVRRVNTPEAYLGTALEVSAGALDAHVAGSVCDAGAAVGAKPVGKKGGKKTGDGGGKAATSSPFASAGERTNVSADSIVGVNCIAGDKASVKKSSLGDNVFLEARVKMNGCVVMDGATLREGVNLTACVISRNAVIGQDCVLKACRVAPGVNVADSTVAEGKDLTGGLDEGSASDADSMDFVFS